MKTKKELASCKRRYRSNNTKHVSKIKAVWGAGRVELIRQFKKKPCADCGIEYPPICMDFDHRDPSAKLRIKTGKSRRTINMAAIAKTFRLSTVLAEIAKCDVVCANCHRLRTEKQRLQGRM